MTTTYPTFDLANDEPPNMDGDPCYCANCDKYLGEGSNPDELCVACLASGVGGQL